VCAGVTTFTNNTWFPLPGGTQSERRDFRICLGINRSPNAALDDTGSRIDEEYVTTTFRKK
jgi:hypothetical protein